MVNRYISKPINQKYSFTIKTDFLIKYLQKVLSVYLTYCYTVMSNKPKIRTLTVKHSPSHFKDLYIYNKNPKGFIFILSLGCIFPILGMIKIDYEKREDTRY